VPRKSEATAERGGSGAAAGEKLMTVRCLESLGCLPVRLEANASQVAQIFGAADRAAGHQFFLSDQTT
jgi:hypothetical protein